MTSVGPSYLRTALLHPGNVLLFLAASGAAAWSGTLAPVAAFGLIEVVWLTAAARLPSFREYFAWREARRKARAQRLGENERLRELGDAERLRFLEVEGTVKEIHRLVAANANLGPELVAGELRRLDELVESFLDLAARTARYERLVGGSSSEDLERELKAQRLAMDAAASGDEREGARKNLALIERRIESDGAVRQQLRAARASLNGVESTVKLLRDQVIAMDSPRALAGTLDELVESMKAVDASIRETESVGSGSTQSRIGASRLTAASKQAL